MTTPQCIDPAEVLAAWPDDDAVRQGPELAVEQIHELAAELVVLRDQIKATGAVHERWYARAQRAEHLAEARRLVLNATHDKWQEAVALLCACGTAHYCEAEARAQAAAAREEIEHQTARAEKAESALGLVLNVGIHNYVAPLLGYGCARAVRIGERSLACGAPEDHPIHEARIAESIAAARANQAFMDRLTERIQTDRDLLDRIADTPPPAAPGCTRPDHDHGAEDYPDAMAEFIAAEFCTPGSDECPPAAPPEDAPHAWVGCAETVCQLDLADDACHADIGEELICCLAYSDPIHVPAAPTHEFEGNGLTGSVECQECDKPASDPVHHHQTPAAGVNAGFASCSPAMDAHESPPSPQGPGEPSTGSGTTEHLPKDVDDLLHVLWRHHIDDQTAIGQQTARMLRAFRGARTAHAQLQADRDRLQDELNRARLDLDGRDDVDG